MADKSWYVSKDGVQLPGEMDTAAVKALLAAEPGRSVLVWAPGMANWAVPSTLPEFAAPTPAPSPAPAAPAPAPAPGPAPAAAAPERPASRPAPIPARVPSKAELQEHAGAFRSLFDFSFDHLVTTKIIRAVYLVIVILVCLGVVAGILGALGSAFAAFRFGSAITGILSLVLAVVIVPVLGLIYLALARVSLEVVIVIFRIKDDLHQILEKKA